jgi:hypothetical protein
MPKARATLGVVAQAPRGLAARYINSRSEKSVYNDRRRETPLTAPQVCETRNGNARPTRFTNDAQTIMRQL